MGHPDERRPSVTNGSVDIDAKTGVAVGNADAALEFLHGENNAVAIEISEKALVRKIDWMIMPLMWAAYNLQYLDKVLSKCYQHQQGLQYLIEESIVNYASVMGLLTDNNIRTNQFSDLTLAFYVTYLFFELPTGFLMQRLPTAKYLGFNGMTWISRGCVMKTNLWY